MIVVETRPLVALIDPKDKLHKKAKKY